MTVLDKYLQELQTSAELVEIFREHTEGSSARLCRINGVSAFSVYATQFDENGEYDGIMVFRKDHITRVRWGDDDLKAQRKLVERHNIVDTPKLNLDSLPEIIESVQQHFGYVVIATEEINDEVIYIGEVVSVDSEFLVLNEYGAKETLDRSMLILRTDEVTRVDADGKYEQTILYLHTQSSDFNSAQ